MLDDLRKCRINKNNKSQSKSNSANKQRAQDGQTVQQMENSCCEMQKLQLCTHVDTFALRTRKLLT